ncbi:hypothetical protein [Nostoc sp.]|uniref:hypothetical protein n=1 Tax=Nostoc sp. TaxID=1180 RepID=UPI002FFA9DF2
MIVLSESTEQMEPSARAGENKLMTEAAQLLLDVEIIGRYCLYFKVQVDDKLLVLVFMVI